MAGCASVSYSGTVCAAISQILLSGLLLCEMGIITIHSGKKPQSNEIPDLALFQA